MLTVAPMRAGHLPAVARLEQLCFSTPWSEQTLRDGLGNPQWAFFVALWEPSEKALPQGQVVGYGGMMFAAGECYIANIAVDPDFRRKGAGTALLKRLILRAREAKGEFISLEVRVSNRTAIALYEKLGFERAGVRKNLYEKPREDGLIYTRWLKQEEEHEDPGH